VITYVPDVQAEFPPAYVEYVNGPPAATATFVASNTPEAPCSVTWMLTLSGSVGVGVIVPVIVYAVEPTGEKVVAGLEKVIEPVAADAASGDSSSATSSGIDRSCAFMLSPKWLPD